MLFATIRCYFLFWQKEKQKAQTMNIFRFSYNIFDGVDSKQATLIQMRKQAWHSEKQ